MTAFSPSSDQSPTDTLAPSLAQGDELLAHGAAEGGHPDHRMFGLATFLVADGMTFAGFFAAYLTFRAVNPLPAGAIYELELILPTINTVLLVVSSFTFHRAAKQLRQNQLGACRLWLLVTAGLGLAFLGGQMVEYFSLPFGLTDNLYASTFYALTGFHGLHVTLGALMILIVWWQARIPGKFTADHHFGVEAAELYWHFVDGIWLILYGILYLL
jgi:cytochrome c oxidase subunit 3